MVALAIMAHGDEVGCIFDVNRKPITVQSVVDQMQESFPNTTLVRFQLHCIPVNIKHTVSCILNEWIQLKVGQQTNSGPLSAESPDILR